MKPPTPQEIIERAEREGRGTVRVSLALLKRLAEAETLAGLIVQQTGITETDPRLGSPWS